MAGEEFTSFSRFANKYKKTEAGTNRGEYSKYTKELEEKAVEEGKRVAELNINPTGMTEEEKQNEMSSEDPGRGFVSEIANANTPEGLGKILNEVENDKKLSHEQINEFVEEINQQQLRLIDNNLLAHGQKKGYEYKTIADLNDLYGLIVFDSHLAQKDKDHYEGLWKNLIEPQAIKIFKSKFQESLSIPMLSQTAGEIEKFNFMDEGNKTKVLDELRTRAKDLFLGRIADLDNSVNGIVGYTREMIEKTTLVDEVVKTDLLERLDKREKEMLSE